MFSYELWLKLWNLKRKKVYTHLNISLLETPEGSVRMFKATCGTFLKYIATSSADYGLSSAGMVSINTF